MADSREIEFFFEPQDDGGYHVYAPPTRIAVPAG